MLLGGYLFSSKNSKLLSFILVKNSLILTFIFIVRIFCKYIFFKGITNIFITILIMCFLSMIILCLNYNKDNNLNPYVVKVIYIPLVLIIFIFSGISLDVFIISFYILINIYFDLSFLYSTGNPGSNLPESSQGSGGVGGSGGGGGSGGNNNGICMICHIPNDEQVHDSRRTINLKKAKVNERYNWVEEYYKNRGTKREFLQAFGTAYTTLYYNPRSLSYNDLAVLKKGFVDYNHILSPEVKLHLHGLAKPGDLTGSSDHGLRTSTLMKNSKSIVIDAYKIIEQIQQEI